MPERTSTSTATSCTVAESVVNIAQATGSDMDSAVVPAVPSPVPSNVSTISSSERLNFVAGQVAAAPSMTGATTPVPMPVILSPAACGKPSRDSSWLELDICRDFQTEGGCARGEQCRFAHTDSSVVTRDGKVTCCYDFLKDRCYRERCKYFHPPAHIKERLVTAGKQYGAMMSNLYSMTGGGMYPATCTIPIQAVQHPVVGFDGCLMTSPPPAPASISPAFVLSPYGNLTERLHVCPEFQRGQCSVELCPFAHPEYHVRQNFDSTVTMCRDFIRTGCQRELCRYFHPPQHIMAQVEAIMSLQAMGPHQGMFIAPSPLMSPPTSMGFRPGPLMYTTSHPSFSLPSPIPVSNVPIYPAAVPVSVISTSRPSPTGGYSHHFPMSNVVSVQSISTQPTSFVQPPLLSPISVDTVNGHQVGAAQMPNLAIA